MHSHSHDALPTTTSWPLWGSLYVLPPPTERMEERMRIFGLEALLEGRELLDLNYEMDPATLVLEECFES